MIDYKDKVVLVTGAASGIGAALANALAARDAQLICADIDADGLKNTVEQIGSAAEALVCDLSDPAAAAKLIDDAYAIAGRLDVVCSNAGIGFSNKLTQTDFDDERIRKLFEINLFAEDMQPRLHAVESSLQALGIKKTY